MDTVPLSKISLNRSNKQSPKSFWTNRLIEAGLVVSMALYYMVGNSNLPLSKEFHTHLFLVNPLYSLPFLVVFAVLCWFRLRFAVALLPLSLPYYLLQKTVLITHSNHYNFSLAEITLGACVVVAFLQMGVSLVRGKQWTYWLSWTELRGRLGLLLVPMGIFILVAACSVVIAYNRGIALRAFREEVADPFVYLLLALACLRSRYDVGRFFGALFSSGLIIALLGLVQYIFFKHTLVLEDGVRRVHAVYGSANSIGLLFDYTLPLGLALCLSRVSSRLRLVALVASLPFLPVLYLTDSRGAWLALTISLLFILAFTIQSRRLRIVGGLVVVAVVVIAALFFRTKISTFLIEGHTSTDHGYTISTVTKRLYLWESAWRMIQHSPWLGYGMDNWLCHYSNNNVCPNHNYHYWIVTDASGHPTGLKDEPDLSHPHNIFLHVWVSMGIFGLLAFIAVIVMFFVLFARVLRRLKGLMQQSPGEAVVLRAMTVGIAAAMIAALVQGQIDSAFLEQDLAFCFWILVASLLLIRWLVSRAYSAMEKRTNERTEAFTRFS